jgi:hypothetical protein
VDRGHRELPVQADVTGLTVTTDHSDRVRVRLSPVDEVDEVVREVSDRSSGRSNNDDGNEVDGSPNPRLA